MLAPGGGRDGARRSRHRERPRRRAGRQGRSRDRRHQGGRQATEGAGGAPVHPGQQAPRCDHHERRPRGSTHGVRPARPPRQGARLRGGPPRLPLRRAAPPHQRRRLRRRCGAPPARRFPRVRGEGQGCAHRRRPGQGAQGHLRGREARGPEVRGAPPRDPLRIQRVVPRGGGGGADTRGARAAPARRLPGPASGAHRPRPAARSVAAAGRVAGSDAGRGRHAAAEGPRHRQEEER